MWSLLVCWFGLSHSPESYSTFPRVGQLPTSNSMDLRILTLLASKPYYHSIPTYLTETANSDLFCCFWEFVLSHCCKSSSFTGPWAPTLFFKLNSQETIWKMAISSNCDLDYTSHIWDFKEYTKMTTETATTTTTATSVTGARKATRIATRPLLSYVGLSTQPLVNFFLFN